MQEKLMAASTPSHNDYFFPGSTVSCVTCRKDEITGEVYAFDHESKILLLKQPSTSGKPELNNLTMLNLDFVESVDVIKECTDKPPTLSALDTKKLLQRYSREFELKVMLSKALSAGVTNEGISLFLFIKKIFKDTVWSGQAIVVMEEVTIKSPYKPEDCFAKSTSSSQQCLGQVRNTVERFYKEERTKSTPTT